MSLDIVSLIENNPLSCLNSDSKSRFINKIKEKFTDTQQKLFISSFYCYLNHNPNTDFVINLDNIWKWLGFQRKRKCKELLKSFFKEGIDYNIQYYCAKRGIYTTSISIETNEKQKEKILLTVNTFKKLCLKARTSKADEIHDYYIGMESMIQELIMEESTELQKKLQVKDIQKEKLLISNFNKKPIVYIGIVEDDIIKFGYTDNIERRLSDHKREINNNFTFEFIYESVYNREIERMIKKILKDNIITKEINGKKQTELIKGLPVHKVNEIIEKIKNDVEFIEKDKNKNIIIESLNLKLKLFIDENEKLKEEIIKLKNENLKIKEELKLINNKTDKNVTIQENSMHNLKINNILIISVNSFSI